MSLYGTFVKCCLQNQKLKRDFDNQLIEQDETTKTKNCFQLY